MGRVRLPSPADIEVIRKFLFDSCKLMIEGVEFSRPSSGIAMRVTFRDFEDRSHTKTIAMPDCDDFEEITLVMSDFLDEVSGVALALMERKKRRLANA